ncbi:disease resistance protein (TIR-NBS-LRR class) [Artemisia annua]|uniref:Disease resistance protein (TIR-NBS-LRR class) n=1 Tax=Artemisia annua TaxID=35608 RepID=A0A2U1MNE6_ARTAN|nr:disease resistance protein (TIR-NBS-LRR class) [Artemisia annua]QAV82485.1 NPR4 [Artemisia annua]
MASTSNSSILKSFKYDVFLSFRGEDTRNKFVSHLFQALKQKGIKTYKDDQNIEEGKMISEQLIKSIENSRFYIIVFSKNYASSSWCLDELVKIMECQTTRERTAYPVFHDVEPTEVRKQSGPVRKAFAKNKKKEAAQKWRDAMKEASNLAGWELKATANGDESKLIQTIVDNISKKLRSISSSIDGKLVGMEMRINEVLTSLKSCTEDVRVIGITGMGGGGKTTLARAVYVHISSEFEGKSFVENVREVSKTSLLGLKSLQKQVLSDVLNDQGITVSSVADGKDMMGNMMRSRKFLVVLDDVDHIDQLEALAGKPNWFKSGSTIIITTRDEQVLVSHGVSLICNVNLLSDKEALCLFSRYTFGREIPFQGYEQLSGQVVRYAAGLPLTIRVLGSFLRGKKELDRYTFGREIPFQGYEQLSGQVVRYAAGLPLTIRVLGSFLRGKKELEWKDGLERLKTIPQKEIQKVLEISFDDLENDYKEIFLDVACLLKGEQKDRAIQVFESCGFNAIIGLRVLEQKSLITISEYGSLGMHDHVEEMGKNIVSRLHPDASYRHSRLWINGDIENYWQAKVNEATRCIKLSPLTLNLETVMRGLGNMKKLRVLYMCSGPNWKDNQVSQRFPNALKYLSWRDYPFSSLHETFQADNLVGLDMSFSTIENVRRGRTRKVLDKLRFLDLSYTPLNTLNLEVTPNLEILYLEHCKELIELYIPDGSPKLQSLNLNNSKLKSLNLGPTPNLEALTLVGCCDLEELCMPFRCTKLKSLSLNGSKLRNLSLGPTPNLKTLSLVRCRDLEELLPFRCTKLKSLSLHNSQLRNLDLGPTPDLETLSLAECDLEAFHVPFRCPKLKFLSLNGSKLRNLHLGRLTPDLETLSLAGCDLEELHLPYGCPKLISLILNNSKLRTLYIELTPNLERLDLKDCLTLVEINAPVGCLEKLVHLDLSGCGRYKSFLFDKRAQSLDVGSLSELHLIAKSIDRCPMHPVNNLPKLQFTCFYKEDPAASSFGNLEKLISIGQCVCANFESFSKTICSLNFLRKLTLEGSILEVPKDLQQLQCLEELILSNTDIIDVPFSVSKLKQLKSLKLQDCPNLEVVSLLCIGQLESLEELTLFNLKIPSLPFNLVMLKQLKFLKLQDCQHVMELPKGFGLLDSLEKLMLSSTGISRLPDDICKLKHLKYLEIGSLRWDQKLLEDLGRLQCLEKLILRCCQFSGGFSYSIFELKSLIYLHLLNCTLDDLPEELGHLKCLEELDITGTNISHLPHSIFQLKGLRIVGFKRTLELCGLTPVKRTSNNGDYETFCYTVV